MDRPREIVIHQSANRPHLLLGADRELVLFAALLSAMLMFALVTWWGVLAGIALWFISVAVLSRMGKSDPTPAARVLATPAIRVVLLRKG